MARAQFSPFVVLTGDGIRDGTPLPKVGSGLRLVSAKIGRKWVYLRYQGAPAGRVSLATWRNRVTAVPFTGQSLGAALAHMGRMKK